MNILSEIEEYDRIKNALLYYGYDVSCRADISHPFEITSGIDRVEVFDNIEQVKYFTQGLIRAYQDIDEKQKQQDPDAAPMKGIIE